VTLDELASQLPNGFHDAVLRSHSSDLAEQRAEFVLDVWVEDSDRSVVMEGEPYRPAHLELFGLAYLVLDDPDPRYLAQSGAPLRIDACAADENADLARQVPEGGFAGRFFVFEWNAFIHFAAREARLTWLDVH